MSRSTGRISRSFVTRSLHLRESATYFSMHSAYPPILSLLFPLICCKSFFSFFLLRFITPSFVLTACTLSLCLVSLSVSLSTSLSYFASFFSPSYPLLLLLVYYFKIQVFMLITLSLSFGLSSPVFFSPAFLTFCLFFCGVLSSVLQVLSGRTYQECRGVGTKIPVCLLLMQHRNI